MPHDLVLKTMNTVHRGILAVTGGKFGGNIAGMPVLDLTTTGRKSGKKHTILLTSPAKQDGKLVIVASRGGDPQHPAWFLNLRDNPTVEVQVKGEAKQTMHARILDGDERDEVWERLSRKYRNYAGYQKRTTRKIPLVVLEPPA